MNVDVGDILQLSPPVALVVVLNLIGFYLKKSPTPNWVIPIILMGLGGAAFPFIADYSKIDFQCHLPEVLNIIYGMAIGGFSVGVNQVVKQFLDRKNGQESKGTSVNDKPTQPPTTTTP